MSDEPKQPSQEIRKQEATVFRLVSGKQEHVQKLLNRPNLEARDGAVASNAVEREDEYHDLYVGQPNSAGLLEPPYPLRQLERLCLENNALVPCIEAMATNIDGTGYSFENIDNATPDAEDDKNIQQLSEFFAQPWPGESFVEMRKDLRRDLERTGNAYLEILRNAQDEIVFFRRVDAKMMRLVKLDNPVPVRKTLRRNGKEVSVNVMQRERRFAQLLNGVTLVYFKEFGSSRDLDKNTGLWADPNKRLPANRRATEIQHFTCLPDTHTPYGIPRWLSQLPSVLGSRKAEEFNLEFFDNGGVPPALIVLQGGTLQADTRKALEQKMTGPASKRNRIQVLEVEPAGGSLDKPTQARVSVERFGGDRTNDSMFENYDAKCEMRVRRSFRLPPMFVGQAADYAFATAFVSTTVTEAQVFKPERDEFDAIFSIRILPAMGYSGYKLVSKPLTIEDVNLKMGAIRDFKDDPRVSDEDILSAINATTGLHFKLVPEEQRKPSEPSMTVDENGDIVDLPSPREKEVDLTARDAAPIRQPARSQTKKSDTRGVLALAKDTLDALRKRDFTEVAQNMVLVQSLDARGLAEFRKACASLQFVDPDLDSDGLADLAQCTLELLSRTRLEKAGECCEH